MQREIRNLDGLEGEGEFLTRLFVREPGESGSGIGESAILGYLGCIVKNRNASARFPHRTTGRHRKSLWTRTSLPITERIRRSGRRKRRTRLYSLAGEVWALSPRGNANRFKVG